MKSSLEIIRSEIVAIQEERLRLFQIGISLLTALEVALFYIRRDIHDHLGLLVTQPLPFNRFIVGTGVLTIIASIFSALMVAISMRNQSLRKLYNEKGFEAELPLNPRIIWAMPLAILCFYIIPLMDLGIRLYLSIYVD